MWGIEGAPDSLNHKAPARLNYPLTVNLIR